MNTAKVIDNMSNEAYHTHEGSVSKSGLDQIAKSPLHYWSKYLDPNRTPAKWTDALVVGSAVHCLLLEPQRFDDEFIIMPKLDLRTKVGKEAKEEIDRAADGKIVIKETLLNQCNPLVDAVENHPLASAYLDGFGKAEQSIFWQWSDELPIQLRCRPDYIREDGVVVDLKTTREETEASFQRSAVRHRYHVQLALYTAGYYAAYGEYPKAFVFVAVSKVEPYPVFVIEADEHDIARGLQVLEDDLTTYYTCLQADEWPGPNNNEMIRGLLPPFMKTVE